VSAPRIPNLAPALLFLLAFTPATAQPSPQPPAADPLVLSEDLRLEPLGDGIWRHVSYHVLEDFGRSGANGLLVVSEGEAALLDTPWTDSQTARLLDWVEEELGAQVTVVISTHSHPDCLGGLAEAHRRGARSYALRRTVELAREAGAEVPRIPVDDFAEIRVGSRRLELHFIGPGHTEDNGVVWIPEAGVLFGGCLVRSASSRHLGYTDEADLEQWPRTLERLKELYAEARWIVPGHGSPGGVELLDRTLELLEERRAPSMLPASLEYLFLNLIFFVLLVAIFGGQIKPILREPPSWISLALFLAFAVTIEILALDQGWWAFNADKVVGVYLAGIPLEELILMVELHLFFRLSWDMVTT